jgi:hypothetical protein
MERTASAAKERPAADLRAGVHGAEGFMVFRALASDELAAVRAAIEKQWIEHIRANAPEHADAFRARGLARYHELSHLVDHASLWPKSARILPADAVALIRATGLCRLLEDAFGRFDISDEEALGREDIYWRLVRPAAERLIARPAAERPIERPVSEGPIAARAANGDTGPVHADRWFWELGHGETPAGVERIKVWVAVITEPGLSGLSLLPGSHRREWRYHGEMRHGFVKPVIDEDVERLGLELVRTEPGDAVVFNDGLLHGGGESRGAYTRVSFELTMFVRTPARGAQ